MKSGPGPSVMPFGANETTIDPALPSETTSVLPRSVPPPTGGPSTIPGICAAPNPAHGPGVNETTPVTKRSAGKAPPSAASTPPASLPSSASVAASRGWDGAASPPDDASGGGDPSGDAPGSASSPSRPASRVVAADGPQPHPARATASAATRTVRFKARATARPRRGSHPSG